MLPEAELQALAVYLDGLECRIEHVQIVQAVQSLRSVQAVVGGCNS